MDQSSEDRPSFFLPRHEYDAYVRMSKEAVKLALLSLNKRLDGMNEFRESMRDQANRTIPRNEYEAQYKNLVDRVDQIATQVNVFLGHSTGQNALITNIIAGTAVLIALASVFLGHIK